MCLMGKTFVITFFITLDGAFPKSIMPIGVEHNLKQKIRKKLRKVGWDTLFRPGEEWERTVGGFAIRALDTVYTAYGQNPWFWGVAWPAVLGAAAADFWPHVATPLERHAVAPDAPRAVWHGLQTFREKRMVCLMCNGGRTNTYYITPHRRRHNQGTGAASAPRVRARGVLLRSHLGSKHVGRIRANRQCVARPNFVLARKPRANLAPRRAPCRAQSPSVDASLASDPATQTGDADEGEDGTRAASADMRRLSNNGESAVEQPLNP